MWFWLSSFFKESEPETRRIAVGERTIINVLWRLLDLRLGTDLLTLGDEPITALLPKEIVARLTAAGTRMNYADGRLIHGRGDDKPGFSIVVEGAVRFVRRLADGGALTNSVLGPGHSFGEATIFAGWGRAYDAIAVGDTAVDQIPKAAFERLLGEEPVLANAMLVSTTRRLYAVLAFLDDLRSLPLETRAAKLIFGMAASAKAPERVECRQSDLAFTLGVSRVSIGKALSSLKDTGLIELGYGEIRIPDRAALGAWIVRREG